jgi:large subunit ribosomal protein L10
VERKTKQAVVSELESRLKRANALFLAEYSGMKVAQITRLRRELERVGGEFKVAKNTLLKIAADGTDAAAILDQFVGPNAVICSYKDPVGIAKLLAGLAKEMPLLKVKSGILGKQKLGLEDITRLSTLPSREVLLAKLLGLMQAPPQRMVGVLAANINKLVWTLSAIKSKKEAM